jgi:2-dehydropantoate 2-reductase
MRIAVIGAGAIGGALAALLDRAGNDVEVTARGTGLAAIRSGGIRLSGQWGEHVAHVTAGERLSRRAELAIVATKAVDAPGALRDNLEWLGGIPVLVVQNGLSGISAAVEAAPTSDIVGGLAVFAASFLEPGVVTVTTGGPLYVGVADETSDIPARFVAQVLGSVLETIVVPDFTGAQWTKLIVNQVNAIPAITGLSVQSVISDHRLRRVMTASMRENVRVARELGIRFAPMNGLGNGALRLVGAAPLWLGQLLPLAMRRRMGAVPNPGSTQQSIRRGQPTEIDYLNGAVVDAARGTPVPTPVNAALVTMVHEVEKTGQFLPTSELVSRAG